MPVFSDDKPPVAASNYLCIILSLILILYAGVVRSDIQGAKNILILHSYHMGYAGTDEMQEGVMDTLREENNVHNLYIEYMDTKRYSTKTVFRELYNLYKIKYRKIRFDVIISSDDNALDFLLLYRNELFPGTPVSFCGINDYQEDRTKGQPLITGVSETFDFRSTLDVINDLLPHIRNIAVVAGSSISSGINLRKMKALAPEYSDRYRFIYLTNLTKQEMIEKLGSLKPDTAVFNLSFWIDRNGEALNHNEGLMFLSEHSNVPIFTAWEHMIAYGTLGGMATSGYLQGRFAAMKALQILGGVNADDIPVLKESPNRYIFDYEQMVRFDIQEEDLPGGSIVKNHPYSMYDKHKTVIWIVIFSFITLVLFVVSLLININHKKRAQRELRESEERYRNIIDNSSFGIGTYEESGNCIVANKALAEIIGATVDQLLAQNIHTIKSWKSSGLLDAAKEALESGEIKTKTVHINSTFGKEVWLDCKFIPYYERGDKHLMFITEDIIEKKKTEEERERLNRELEQIVYITSHDLRTPLVNVNGYSRELTKSVQKIISVIENEGLPSEILDRIASLSRDIPESLV